MLLWMRKQEIGASRRRLIIDPPPRGEWWLARFECAPHSRWRKADGASKSGREVTMGCEAEIECQRAQMEIPVAQPGERDRHPQIEQETMERHAGLGGEDVRQVVWRRAQRARNFGEEMRSFRRARDQALR